MPLRASSLKYYMFRWRTSFLPFGPYTSTSALSTIKRRLLLLVLDAPQLLPPEGGGAAHPAGMGLQSLRGEGDAVPRGRRATRALVTMTRVLLQIVANYYGNRKVYEPVEGKRIHWAGGKLSPPPDTPECGFDHSGCPPEGTPRSLTSSSSLSSSSSSS